MEVTAAEEVFLVQDVDYRLLSHFSAQTSFVEVLDVEAVFESIELWHVVLDGSIDQLSLCEPEYSDSFVIDIYYFASFLVDSCDYDNPCVLQLVFWHRFLLFTVTDCVNQLLVDLASILKIRFQLVQISAIFLHSLKVLVLNLVAFLVNRMNFDRNTAHLATELTQGVEIRLCGVNIAPKAFLELGHDVNLLIELSEHRFVHDNFC